MVVAEAIPEAIPDKFAQTSDLCQASPFHRAVQLVSTDLAPHGDTLDAEVVGADAFKKLLPVVSSAKIPNLALLQLSSTNASLEVAFEPSPPDPSRTADFFDVLRDRLMHMSRLRFVRKQSRKGRRKAKARDGTDGEGIPDHTLTQGIGKHLDAQVDRACNVGVLLSMLLAVPLVLGLICWAFDLEYTVAAVASLAVAAVGMLCNRLTRVWRRPRVAIAWRKGRRKARRKAKATGTDGESTPNHTPTTQIFIKDLHNKTHTVDAALSDNLEIVKEKINKKTDMHFDFYFVYEGKVLDNNSTLGSYGVRKQSTLHMSVRLPGGMPGGGSSRGAGSSSSAAGANGRPEAIHPYLWSALNRLHEEQYPGTMFTGDVASLEHLQEAFDFLCSTRGQSIAQDMFADPNVMRAVNQSKDEWTNFLHRRSIADEVQNDRRVRQRTEQVRPSRPKLLAEMTDAELDNQYERFKEQIESTHERLIREVNTLLPHGWGELLRVIMDAHADQKYPNSTNLKERRVKLVHTVCINGDVQRGKSTVEALIAVINWTIHNSPEVHDKVCTFCVTQLQSWASALRETFQIKTAAAELPHDDNGEEENSSEDEDEDQFEEGGIDAEDLGSMPIVQKRKGVTAMEVKSTLRQGGCAVAFRTHTQYQWYAKQVVEMNSELASYEKSLSMCVVLDEADKFFGDNCAHAKELYRMCGFDGNRQPNKPVMVIAVSATNPGPVYWLLRRERTLVRNQQVMKVADIVSFKPAAPNTYSTQSESFLEPGVLMELPRRADEYVTSQVVDIYQDFLSRACALMVDTLCTIVNTYVAHNMCEHVAVVVEELQRRGEQTPFVVLYGHGQETSFPGMMGLQFCLEEHLPEADRMMRKLETSMVEAADEERNLAHNLTASGDADGAAAARARAAALEHEAGQLDENLADYDCLPVHHLSPLAWHIKAKALRLGHYQADKMKGMLPDPPPSFNIDDMIGEQRFNFGENLQLVLLIIRKYIGAEVPIAVVAGTMLRRCMSVVAVDYFRAEISRERDGDNLAEAHYDQPYPLAVVSHMILKGGANAPDGHQTAKRDNHTLTAFEFLHPDLASTKKLMVPELAVAAEAFIGFNAMEELRKPLADRRLMLRQISEATRGSERLRTIDNYRTGLAARVGDEAAARFDTLVTKVRSVRDLGADPDYMLALGCALARHLKLPLPTRQLFQTSKTPMFQIKCGLPERDLGNIHANMVTIAENGTPPDFRHAIATRRGRGAGEPSSVVAFAANWMRDHGFVANANGGAPPNPPEAWTVMLGLRAQYPDLIDTPGYSQMSPTATGSCGLGYAMKELCTRQIAGVSKTRRPAPARPAMSSFPNPNGEARDLPARAVGPARQVNVYWLKRGAVVPALPAVQAAAAAALPAPAQ